MATSRRLRRILFVEDDPSVSSGITALLEAEGVEVLRAGSLAEARRVLPSGKAPDALILDVALGDGSGIDLYRDLLRAGQRYPAVFISGHADERIIVEFRSEPVAFLSKPFEFSDLWAQLQRVYGSRS